MFTGSESSRALTGLFAALALMALAVLAWRWAVREGAYRFCAQHLAGTLLGLMAIALAAGALINLANLAQEEKRTVPRDVTLLAPVQQAGSALTVEVANLADKPTVLTSRVTPGQRCSRLAVWVFGWISRPAGVEDCRLGSGLDAAGMGGLALSEWCDGIPHYLRGVPAPGGGGAWIAQAGATPAPTAAGLAARCGPERRCACHDGVAGGRVVVGELEWRGVCGGVSELR